VVVEAAPAAPFEIPEPDLLFEFLIIALGAVAGVVGICRRRNLQFVQPNRIGIEAPMEITP
jgi:hypothetical protein